MNPELNIKQKVEEQKATKAQMKTKMNSFLRYLPNIIINAFAVIALMIMTMLILDFDSGYLLSLRGAATSLVLMAIFTTSHWSTYDMRVKALKQNEENKKYIKAQETEIKKVTATVAWQDHKEEFINERNLDKKIEQWKIIIENQIVKLEQKAKKKDLDIEALAITEFQKKNLNEIQLKMLQEDIDKQKSKNRYLQRKKALEEMRTDTWIAENVIKKNIDYNKIDVMFIETGSVVKGQDKDKVEKRGKYAKDNSGQRVFSILISIFLTAISTDLAIDGFTREAWFIFTFRIMILVFNIIMGLNYGDNYFTETDIHNVDARAMISDEFKVWCLKRGFIK
jgi:hypothetical protein